MPLTPQEVELWALFVDPEFIGGDIAPWSGAMQCNARGTAAR
jgi:hypothetical protein